MVKIERKTGSVLRDQFLILTTLILSFITSLQAENIGSRIMDIPEQNEKNTEPPNLSLPYFNLGIGIGYVWVNIKDFKEDFGSGGSFEMGLEASLLVSSLSTTRGVFTVIQFQTFSKDSDKWPNLTGSSSLINGGVRYSWIDDGYRIWLGGGMSYIWYMKEDPPYSDNIETHGLYLEVGNSTELSGPVEIFMNLKYDYGLTERLGGFLLLTGVNYSI